MARKSINEYLRKIAEAANPGISLGKRRYSDNEYIRRIAEGVAKNGTAATIDSVSASVDDQSGTPSVTVTTGGTPMHRTISLAFSGIKGEDGAPGEKGETGETGPQGPSGYVLTESDKNDIAGRVAPTVVTESAPTAITLADNTDYYLTDVSDLTITYPSGDFACWLHVQMASSGTVAVSLPSSTYVGTMPSFGVGETWEVSIRNGTVIAGLVVAEG